MVTHESGWILVEHTLKLMNDMFIVKQKYQVPVAINDR